MLRMWCPVCTKIFDAAEGEEVWLWWRVHSHAQWHKGAAWTLVGLFVYNIFAFNVLYVAWIKLSISSRAFVNV